VVKTRQQPESAWLKFLVESNRLRFLVVGLSGTAKPGTSRRYPEACDVRLDLVAKSGLGSGKVVSVAKEGNVPYLDLAMRDLTREFAEKVDASLPAFTTSQIAARLREIDEAPVRGPLAEARQLENSDVVQAWEKVDVAGRALRGVEGEGKARLGKEIERYRAALLPKLTEVLTKKIKSGSGRAELQACERLLQVSPKRTRSKAIAARDGLKVRVLERVGKLAKQGAIKEARELIAALHRLGVEASDLQVAKQAVEEASKVAAKALTQKAGRLAERDYQEAERVLVHALSLDSGNEEAKSHLATVREIKTRLWPTYVADLHLAKDGAGLKVSFGLKAASEKLTLASGSAQLRLYLVEEHSGRHSMLMPNHYWNKEYDVPTSAFGRVSIFPLGLPLPRIAFSSMGSVNQFPGPGDARFVKWQFTYKVRVVAEITFTPTGGKALTFRKVVNPYFWQ